jgi:septal ring factor EnvC (AmiA/AmiB activator)
MLVDEIQKLIKKIEATEDALRLQRREFCRERLDKQTMQTETRQTKRRKVLAMLQRLLTKQGRSSTLGETDE